jgi:hypothetical protein
MSKLEQLDKKAESTVLSPHELDIKHCLNMPLIQLLGWGGGRKSNGTKDQRQAGFSKEIATQFFSIW